MERQTGDEMSIMLLTFSLVLEAEIEADKRRYNETNPYYGVYRALKSTMRSKEMDVLFLSTTDVYSIVNFLKEDINSRYALKDWIETSRWDWEMGLMSKNARKIYAVGKQEMLRDGGAKHTRNFRS